MEPGGSADLVDPAVVRDGEDPAAQGGVVGEHLQQEGHRVAGLATADHDGEGLVQGGEGLADEVVLVLMPGSGDSVQALKAGIMEIPDVIAVNKMDQPGAKALQNDIRGVIALDPNAGRRPPIVRGRRGRLSLPVSSWSVCARGDRRSDNGPRPIPSGRC